MLLESETIELKKSLAQLKEGVISLSAMLNKKNEGVVYFGINDEGRVCGITIGKKTKTEVAHEIRNNLKPLPQKLNVEETIMDGKEVLVVSVSGNDTPYSAYGRYFLRLNDSDVLMTPMDLEHFFKSKDDTYLSWEQQETNYTPDDIDENLLIDCIRTANEKGRLNYVYRNANEALMKLGLLTENGKLNNAGLYLFGRNKPLTIKEATYPTDFRTEFGEIKDFKGNIIECINEAINYIQNRITFKARIVGLQREEEPEIPIRAIREIVVNSFAHCSYARQGDCNSYIIYRSQIRIYNPGTILKNIDPIRFASGAIGSKIRNVLISQALYDYGYIDAFGTGFDRTFTLCAKDNIEYDYHNDEFGFTFVFQRKKDFLESEDSKIADEGILSHLDDSILKLIRENKYATAQSLKEKTGKSVPTIQRHLKSLAELGYLRRVGSKKSGFWKLLK